MAIKADAGGEGAGTRSALAEINVIPLVDVVLVLLLIFMLTAPMMYRGIDVNLPRSGGKWYAIISTRFIGVRNRSASVRASSV